MPVKTIPLLSVLFLVMFAVPHAGQAAETERLGAESIHRWNTALYRMLQELNRFDRDNRPHTSGDNPCRSARSAAMMHGAIFDAVNGISRQYEPYRIDREDDAPASREAAVMQAAFVVLNGMFGEGGTELAGRDIATDMQAELNSFRQTHFVALLDRLDAGELTMEELENGIAWGQQVGEAMLEWRHEDGAHVQVEYDDHVVEHGKYRMDTWTPDADVEAAEPGWGRNIKPFALESVDQFMPPGPPEHGSEEWERDLAEVREMGRRDRYEPENYEGGVLPDEIDYQYRTAFFWAAKGLNADGSKNALGTVTPPGEWCKITDYVVKDRDLSLEEAARVYALTKIAGVDSTSACWYVKYEEDYWRPIHAIRWGIEEGADHPDADWLPLVPTSQHPEYLSGHSTTSAAVAEVLTQLFGEEVEFSLVGDDAVDGERRTFTNFWDAAEEAGRSRIYGGIHYEFTNRHSLDLGGEVGAYVYENFLRPVEQTAAAE